MPVSTLTSAKADGFKLLLILRGKPMTLSEWEGEQRENREDICYDNQAQLYFIIKYVFGKTFSSALVAFNQ